MPGRHPLDWRREVMVMTPDGEACSVCGWREDVEDVLEIHQAHVAHLVQATLDGQYLPSLDVDGHHPLQ